MISPKLLSILGRIDDIDRLLAPREMRAEGIESKLGALRSRFFHGREFGPIQIESSNQVIVADMCHRRFEEFAVAQHVGWWRMDLASYCHN